MTTPETDSPALRLLTGNRPLIIGHRGYCAIAPENTLPSFKLALEAGADLVELDYHHSKDGVPMAIHDDTLDRTTDARKRWKLKRIKVANNTATEIQTLDAGSWFNARFAGTKVPLLTEALALICGNGGVALIEHKSGDAETLVNLLRAGPGRWGERPRACAAEAPTPAPGRRREPSDPSRLDANCGSRGRSPHQPRACEAYLNKVVVISFDWKFLREFHELEPGQLLGALGPPERLTGGWKPSRFSQKLGARWLDELVRTGAKLAVWSRQVSKKSVQFAHQRGLKVWVYTVNDAKLARQLVGMGVDGVITNRVALVQNALAS